MYFFMLKRTKAAQALVSFLSKLPGAQRRYVDGFKDNISCFDGMTNHDIARTCWVGDATDRDAESFLLLEFANKFNQHFESKFGTGNKANVKHVYLVGCEAGKIDGSYSPAQSIANNLYDKGFTEVKVHAVASPYYNENGAYLLSTQDLIHELDRPHNTFTPHHPEQRPQKIAAQEKALIQIDARIKQLEDAKRRVSLSGIFSLFCRSRANQARDNELKHLRKAKWNVANAVGDQWLHAVRDGRIMFPMDSSNWKLLDDIHSRANAEERDARLHSPSAVAAGSKPFFGSGGQLSQFLWGVQTPLPRELQAVMNQIKNRRVELQAEVRGVALGCSIKQKKINKLKLLENKLMEIFRTNCRDNRGTSLADWQPLINQAMRDQVLTQGIIWHRTDDMLRTVKRQALS